MLSRGIMVFNAFFLVTEFTDYFNWFVFAHCIVKACLFPKCAECILCHELRPDICET